MKEIKEDKKEILIQKFSEALKRLEEAIKATPTRMNKDATIKRFEFCFELSWKAAQAFLKNQGISIKSPKDCFRKAADYGLIENVKLWFDFLEARNLVAHTYNEKMADRIYKITKPFLKNAKELLKKIKAE